MPHGCCVQDPSSPYLLSAWKISFFSQRNQYSGTERKPLGRFALHSSACGLGAGEEGRARTDAGEQCAASHEFPYDSLGAPCLTRITQYKVKAAAKDKSGREKQFSFSLPLCSHVSLWVVLISEDSSPFWSNLPSSGDR